MPQIDVSENVLLLESALAECEMEAIAEQMKTLAQKGFRVRAAEIAEMYELGTEKIPISVERAYSWYFRSAHEENDKDGYLGIARFFFSGIFVDRNPIKAIEYFRKSSDLGSGEANLMLGSIYLRGVGVPRDIEKAEIYLVSAANQGFVAALYLLAQTEKRRRNYLSALRYWWRCIIEARKLTLKDPQDRRLYLLHGAWPAK